MFESKVPAPDGDAGIPAAGSGAPSDSGSSDLSGWLGSLPVGGSATGLLAGVDPVSVSAAERVDLLVAWNRQLSHVQAMAAQVVAVMADLDNKPVVVAGGSITDPVAEEIGCALNMSAFSGHLLVDVSRALVTRLPNVLALLQEGEISLPVAKVMVEEIPATWSGPTDPVPEVEQAMLARLTDRTPAQVRRSVKRVVHRVCPADVDQRAKAAVRGRGVSLFPQPDAMMSVCALLPAADAQYVYATIDKAARRRVNEFKAAAARGEDVIVPGLDATRADIIVELAIRLAADEASPGNPDKPGSGTGSNPGSGSGSGKAARPVRTVAVVIDALTALGLANNPGEIPGYGPVPASVARELAADGQWVRWLTDPDTGALLDAGGRKYRPSTALRNFITARDQYCRFPGCQALATGRTTEIDHAEEFNHANPTVGGQTTRSNLGCLCLKHHRIKTGGLWDISVSDVDGSCEWTSPTGHRYRSNPNDILSPETTEPDTEPNTSIFGDQLWPDVLPEPPAPAPGPQRTDLEQLLADALCG